MTLKERKELLKRIVLEEKHFHSDIYIYRLLQGKELDYLIRNLDDTKIPCFKPIYGIKHFSSEEYFIYLLTVFIGHFRREFPYVCYCERLILSFIFENQKNCLFLLSNRDYHDTSNMEYFQIEMKKSIISNTLENIHYSYKSSYTIRNYFKYFNLDFDNFDFNNKKDIDNLFSAVVKIVEFNFNHPQIFYLFKNPYIVNEALGDKEKYLENNKIALKVLLEELIKKVPLIKSKDLKFLSSYS